MRYTQNRSPHELILLGGLDFRLVAHWRDFFVSRPFFIPSPRSDLPPLLLRGFDVQRQEFHKFMLPSWPAIHCFLPRRNTLRRG